MTYELHSTEIFDEWLDGLKDREGRIAILKRLERASKGNFGDCKPIKDDNIKGLYEMRVDFGPGYRVYYGQTGLFVYLLICGGSKRDQRRDIDSAKSLWNQIKGQSYEH